MKLRLPALLIFGLILIYGFYTTGVLLELLEKLPLWGEFFLAISTMNTVEANGGLTVGLLFSEIWKLLFITLFSDLISETVGRLLNYMPDNKSKVVNFFGGIVNTLNMLFAYGVGIVLGTVLYTVLFEQGIFFQEFPDLPEFVPYTLCVVVMLVLNYLRYAQTVTMSVFGFQFHTSWILYVVMLVKDIAKTVLFIFSSAIVYAAVSNPDVVIPALIIVVILTGISWMLHK